MLERLDGDTNAVNALLDYFAEKADNNRTSSLRFVGFESTVAEIEPEILTIMASKSRNMREIWIRWMSKATEQVKHALTVLTVDIIHQKPRYFSILSFQ